MNILKLFPIMFALLVQLKSQDIPSEPKNFEAVNTTMKEVKYKSKNALRVVEIKEDQGGLAIVNDLHFRNGIIEVELAGKPLPHSDSTARGFVGVAFHVKKGDTIRYDCFYLRPTNGRADDQVRRNHSTQYIAHPDYPWYRLRKEFPSMYESYVDLIEGEWTKVKIEVSGTHAQLFVNNSEQPVLIINTLLNPESSGSVALWAGQGTDAYFRNLKVTKR